MIDFRGTYQNGVFGAPETPQVRPRHGVPVRGVRRLIPTDTKRTPRPHNPGAGARAQAGRTYRASSFVLLALCSSSSPFPWQCVFTWLCTFSSADSHAFGRGSRHGLPPRVPHRPPGPKSAQAPDDYFLLEPATDRAPQAWVCRLLISSSPLAPASTIQPRHEAFLPPLHCPASARPPAGAAASRRLSTSSAQLAFTARARSVLMPCRPAALHVAAAPRSASGGQPPAPDAGTHGGQSRRLWRLARHGRGHRGARADHDRRSRCGVRRTPCLLLRVLRMSGLLGRRVSWCCGCVAL